MPQQIILASQSPRRKQLLEQANIEFSIIVANTNENFPSNLDVKDVPVYIANEKANAVAAMLNNTYNKTIIAADTIVVINKEIIGKPANREEAIQHLQKLSGKTHQVITGVVIIKNGEAISFANITEVEFNTLTQQQIEYYIDNYKPYDKAGAYAIQEWIGVVGIKKINGDFYNVMGLPMSQVLQHL